MAEAVHEEPLSALGILREALVLPKDNKKLILGVFLMSLCTSSLLPIFFSGGRPPFLMDSTPLAEATTRDDDGDIVIEDAASIKMLLYLFLGFPVSAAVKTLVISATAATYTEKMLALKDSPWTWVEGKVRRPPFLTQILVVMWSASTFAWPMSIVLLFFGESAALGMLPTAYISSDALSGSPSSSVLAYFLETICLLFLTTFWSLGVIVSVLEQGRHGLGAVARAMGLARRRTLKGLAVVLAAFVLHGAASEVSYLCYARTARSSWRLQWAVALLNMAAREALNVYISGAYVVYYYECRRRTAALAVSPVMPLP